MHNPCLLAKIKSRKDGVSKLFSRTSHKTIDTMKTFKHLYEKLLDEDFIKKCIYIAARGKRNRSDVREVLNHIDRHVFMIKTILENDAFVPAEHQPKIIVERGKQRTIITPKFKYEAIVHTMIVEVLQPILLPRFYQYSCASIPKKGSSFGRKTIVKWIRKIYRTHKYCPRFYILKVDIKKYFENIDREILKIQLSRLIADNRFLTLLYSVIDCAEVNGLPLGFVTSQWLANFCLTCVDNFVNQNLKQPYYIRYMDDMVVFSTDKASLHDVLMKLHVYLKAFLHLTLKRNYQIFQFIDDLVISGKFTGRPLDFMGFKFYPSKVTLRKKTLRGIRRKILRVKKKLRPTVYDCRCIMSKLGMLKHLNTYSYFSTYLKPHVHIKRVRLYISQYDRRNAA